MDLNRVSKIDNSVKINNVLLSVADKSGLNDLIPAMVNINRNIRFYSTGGTYKKINEILGDAAGEHLVAVSDYTGQPEMQGGLVKTLDFKIYLGLLSETYNDAHQQDLKRTNAVAIDMVIVNLYPFSQTVAKKDITLEDARTNIDIGGPCMLRAGAKNFLRTASVCDPSDYPGLIEKLQNNNGSLIFKDRLAYAKKAFQHTADYDSAIFRYLESQQLDLSYHPYSTEV